MMSSLVYGLDMYVRGEDCESQCRKMLYFCYEIYQAYLYSSRNYVHFLCRGRMLVFNPVEKMQKLVVGLEWRVEGGMLVKHKPKYGIFLVGGHI